MMKCPDTLTDGDVKMVGGHPGNMGSRAGIAQAVQTGNSNRSDETDPKMDAIAEGANPKIVSIPEGLAKG